MREKYEAWFRGFYKQEPMPVLGAPAHDFCWAGYIAGAASRDAEVAGLREQLATANMAYEVVQKDCWNLTQKVIPNLRDQLTIRDAEIESLRQQLVVARAQIDMLNSPVVLSDWQKLERKLAESQKREVMLRDAIEKYIPESDHYSDNGVKFYAELLEALAAMEPK